MPAFFFWAAVFLGVVWALFVLFRRLIPKPDFEPQRLATEAFNSLVGKTYTTGEFGFFDEQKAIYDALDRKDTDLLAAYANMGGSVYTEQIDAVVRSIRHAEETGNAGSLTVRSLTHRHVQVFLEATMAACPADYFRTLPHSEASKVGVCAIKNLDDYALVMSIIKDRGVHRVDDLEATLLEMKSSPSKALADGAL